MGLRSRTLACAATSARQTQCLQHHSGLYRPHGRVVVDPEVMRRSLSLRKIPEAYFDGSPDLKNGMSRSFGLERLLA